MLLQPIIIGQLKGAAASYIIYGSHLCAAVVFEVEGGECYVCELKVKEADRFTYYRPFM